MAAIEEQPVNQYQQIEEELRQKKPGWWKRTVASVPELAALSNTPQAVQYHAEGDVAVHTRMAVEACPADCEPDLLWAALVHDIGKPLMTRDDGENITSYGHEVAGAQIAGKILDRLGMPVDRRERISWAVRHHTFHFAWNLEVPEDASPRHRRFVTDLRFPLLLELLRADSAASLGSPGKMKAYELYRRLWEMVSKS